MPEEKAVRTRRSGKDPEADYSFLPISFQGAEVSYEVLGRQN